MFVWLAGTYAFRVPDDNEEGGMWVGYEDPDTAGNKAGYIRYFVPLNLNFYGLHLRTL